MQAKELREKYLQFFKEKRHEVIPGASLIPEHDPTVLFTTAGMHPLVPFLLGEKHPAGQRLANVQRCVRTGDIDSVGDSWHLTFFEMLGNWSLGSYWKEEAINWSFEFLTDKKWLGIPVEKLNITVFAGDKDAPKDKESAQIWQRLGIPKERVYFLGKNENWWGPAGQTGPCGPCTEMFYDTGKDKCGNNCQPGCSCGKYAEIWNDVFMGYNRNLKSQKSNLKSASQISKIGKGQKNGGKIKYEYVPLKQKNVDTGMGVERTVAVLNGYDNVYETELFQPIIKKIEELTTANYQLQTKNYRIIADHLKTATFILAENIEPSNVEQGYVLRRLIRRAVRYGKQLGIENIFCHKIAWTVVDIYKDIYPELLKNKDFIEEQLVNEEEKFSQTLEKGLKEIKKITNMTGEKAFSLYETYGFPLEITEEITKVENKEGFFKALKKHQELSRIGAEQKFKGGLADHSEEVTKYHTATHLLLAALRKVLGNHVFQRGSNITVERLRFDFSHPQKITPEEIKKVEDLVNQKIQENLTVKWEEIPLEDAKKGGAMGVFGGRYGERVKVYTILNEKTGGIFSKEICGGPHVEKTEVLGRFKIVKEEASSAGVRRIKAILE